MNPKIPKFIRDLEALGYTVLNDGKAADLINARRTLLSAARLTTLRKRIKGQVIYRVWKDAEFLSLKLEKELKEILKSDRANKKEEDSVI